MDIMIDFILNSPHDVMLKIAKKAKDKRLSLNLSQQSLSDSSAVSFGVIKKFERTGKISLESLLKIALVLDSLESFSDLFNLKPLESYTSLDSLLDQKTRKRGRK